MQGKIAVDAAVGIPAASSWLWMNTFSDVLTLCLAAGGVVLVILRVLISWREWRKDR